MGMDSLHVAEICRRQQKRVRGGLQKGSTGGDCQVCLDFCQKKLFIYMQHTTLMSSRYIQIPLAHDNLNRSCFLYKFDASAHSSS